MKEPEPPVAALMEAAPLLPPKQETLVCAEAVTEIADGCMTVNEFVAVQPFISVIVTTHVPAIKPVTEVVPSPVGLPGVQL